MRWIVEAIAMGSLAWLIMSLGRRVDPADPFTVESIAWAACGVFVLSVACRVKQWFDAAGRAWLAEKEKEHGTN